MRNQKGFRGQLLFLLLIPAIVTFGQTKQNDLQGWHPYTPTRLEWLAVEANSTSSISLTENLGFSISFAPIEKEDAILIFVSHSPTVDRAAMNAAIRNSRDLINMIAKQKGWSVWLRIKEHISVINY